MNSLPETEPEHGDDGNPGGDFGGGSGGGEPPPIQLPPETYPPIYPQPDRPPPPSPPPSNPLPAPRHEAGDGLPPDITLPPGVRPPPPPPTGPQPPEMWPRPDPQPMRNPNYDPRTSNDVVASEDPIAILISGFMLANELAIKPFRDAVLHWAGHQIGEYGWEQGLEMIEKIIHIAGEELGKRIRDELLRTVPTQL